MHIHRVAEHNAICGNIFCFWRGDDLNRAQRYWRADRAPGFAIKNQAELAQIVIEALIRNPFRPGCAGTAGRAHAVPAIAIFVQRQARGINRHPARHAIVSFYALLESDVGWDEVIVLVGRWESGSIASPRRLGGGKRATCN